MKKIIIPLFVIASTHFSFAKNVSQKEFCKISGDMSEQIMDARQKKVPLSQIMEVAKEKTFNRYINIIGQKTQSFSLYKINKYLILKAYKVDVYNGDVIKDKVIRDFKNNYMESCLNKKI